MNIKELIKFINNNYIISEKLRDTELYGYIDVAIDDINDRLQANFPSISEWIAYVTKYNSTHTDQLDPNVYSVIPPKYLRSVCALGAALNFYTNDEEGEQVASKYYIQYERNITNMVRDYIELVPAEFQANTGGYITTAYNAYENYDASTEGIVMYNDDIYDVL